MGYEGDVSKVRDTVLIDWINRQAESMERENEKLKESEDERQTRLIRQHVEKQSKEHMEALEKATEPIQKYPRDVV